MVRRRSQNEPPPRDWEPTQAVPEPVLNSPYEEPTEHWRYEDGVPSRIPSRRRASYFYRIQEGRVGAAQQELLASKQEDDLVLVNRLRGDVKRWRQSGYRGATAVTRELLRHWSSEDLPRRLFFCQREAVETVIYLLEMAIPGRLARTGYRRFGLGQEDLSLLLSGQPAHFEEIPQSTVEEGLFPRLVDIPSEENRLPLRRLGCKMATGSGKTVVMAMLIAWAFCNRGRNSASRSFPSAVLVCAPNITVRERLQVLRPGSQGNYYERFNLIPSRYSDLLHAGKVLITNWHAFHPKSPHSEDGHSFAVVDKGEESYRSFALDRLEDLADRLPILVLNDEAHHCWRGRAPARGLDPEAEQAKALRGKTTDEKADLQDEFLEARVWLDGLDKINSCGLLGPEEPGVLACVDLSATPFYLSGSGYPEGSPFPWLVTDFGLIDAIESGIVKVPRLPVSDNLRKADPKYFRLWNHVTSQLRAGDRTTNGRPKPEAIYRETQDALTTLATQWKQEFDKWRGAVVGDQDFIPPVLIVVCDNTDIAQIFFERISGQRTEMKRAQGRKAKEPKTIYGPGILSDLTNEEGKQRTVQIDTKLLRTLDAEEGQSRDEAAQALRRLIHTVGKTGEPGEHVRCVVSVSMLTEGWDASNVTHILGVRAFESQLLCEQVVGRGLRRMSYTTVRDPRTGKDLLPARYVDVYGIPFSLIPFKGRSKGEVPPDPVYHHIHAVPDREELEIRVPVVESYTSALRGPSIDCDIDALPRLRIDDVPSSVYLRPTLGDGEGPVAPADDFVEQRREDYYQHVRFQQVLFRLAQQVVDDLLTATSAGGAEVGLVSRHQLFPVVLSLVKGYVEKKISYAPGLKKQELGSEKYAKLLRQRIRDGIFAKSSDDTVEHLPVLNHFEPVVSTSNVNYRTTRPVRPLARSHLNLAAVDSDDERHALDALEELDFVTSFTPNDRGVGVSIPYDYLDSQHHFEPDFIVRLRGSAHVLLEIKGLKGEIHDPDRVEAKSAAAEKWARAVSNAKSYGDWHYVICRDLATLPGSLRQHVKVDGAPAKEPLPFRIVPPEEREHWVNCVPHVTLRAAAGAWSEDQRRIDPAAFAEDWLTWDGAGRFVEGMFVARVVGDSMEPDIPNGSYCLFRPPPAGTRQGRKLLVWHEGVEDRETGGQFTLKVYRSERSTDDDGAWRHTTIRLEPLNPAHEPLVLTPESEGEVRILAEWVENLRTDRTTSSS